MNALCQSFLEIESMEHYFLRCQNYVTFRANLINELNSTNGLLVALNSDELVRAIFYADKKIVNDSNFKILTTISNS